MAFRKIVLIMDQCGRKLKLPDNVRQKPSVWKICGTLRKIWKSPIALCKLGRVVDQCD
jgi:hypothetical protein